jgi:hypothetical protein
MAVFLALGLGILLGSSVVSDPLDAQLRQNLERANERRDDALEAADELDSEVKILRQRLDEAAPWAMGNKLDGSRFILVGSDDAAQDHVVKWLVAAGAEPFGHLVFEDRLSSLEPADREELVDAVTSIIPACSEGAGSDECFDATASDLRTEALDIVGSRFGDAVGRVVIDGLIEAGFLSAPGRPDGDWPSTDAYVVVLAPGRAESVEPDPGTLAFVRGVSAEIPTLVAAPTPERPSLVSDLRDESGLSDVLSTFDSATAEADPGGFGVFAALIAATEGRGRHFGAMSEPFVAPAPGPG